MADKPLTPKQALFVKEYLIDLNATQAARRAGYSEKTSHRIGAENMQKPAIQSAIAREQASRSERTEITQDRVLQEMARLGFSDLRKCFSASGALLPPSEWDDDTAASIASIEVVTKPTGERDESNNPIIEHVHKIKFWDKNTALANLGKHLPNFFAPEKRELAGANGGPVQVATIDASKLSDDAMSEILNAVKPE